MRYFDFAAHPDHPTINRLNICTLYVPPGAWDDLNDVRIRHGARTQIIVVRSLEPRFRGSSVDIDCGSPGDAARLLFNWYLVRLVSDDGGRERSWAKAGGVNS